MRHGVQKVQRSLALSVGTERAHGGQPPPHNPISQPASWRALMNKALPRRLPAYAQWSKFLQTTLKESTDRDAVMLCNVALIRKQAARWSSLLPSVEPHYGTFAHSRAFFSFVQRIVLVFWRGRCGFGLRYRAPRLARNQRLRWI